MCYMSIILGVLVPVNVLDVNHIRCTCAYECVRCQSCVHVPMNVLDVNHIMCICTYECVKPVLNWANISSRT